MSDIIRLTLVFVIMIVRIPFYLIGMIGKFFSSIDRYLESLISRILK